MSTSRFLLLATGVLVVCLLIAFPGAILGSEDLRFGLVFDPIPVYLFLPGDFIASQAFQAGYFPLWDHMRGIGTPHLVPTGVSLVYVLKLPFYFLDDVFWQNIYILLRLIIGGLGAGMFAITLGAKRMGAIAACIAYAFSGYMMELMPFQEMGVHAFTPWIFWAFTMFLKTRKIKFFIAAWISFVWAGNGGHVEPIFYAFTFSGIYYVLYALYVNPSRTLKDFLVKDIIPIICLYLLAIFQLGALPFYPFVEYFALSEHYHTGIVGNFHNDARGIFSFLTLLNNGAITSWLQETSSGNLPNIPLPTYYIGCTVFVASVAAILSPRKLSTPAILASIIGIVLLGLIFGIPPFGWLGYLPLFHFTFNFQYAMPIVALMFSVLAGVALSIKAKAWLSTGLALGIMVITAFIIIRVLEFPFYIYVRPAVATVIIIASGILLHLERRAKNTKENFHFAFIALLFIELFLAKEATEDLFWKGKFELHRKEHFVEFLKAQPKHFRYLSPDGPAFHPNRGVLYGINDIKDQSPMLIKPYAELVSALQGLKGSDATDFRQGENIIVSIPLDKIVRELFDLTGIRYILSEQHLYEKSIRFSYENYSVMRTVRSSFVLDSDSAIGKVKRQGIFMHAPAQVSLKLGDNRENSLQTLAFYVGIEEKSKGSDGVHFSIFEDKNGGIGKRIYSKRIPPDPKKWHAAELEVSADLKKSILVTTPGHEGDMTSDFGRWGELRFTSLKLDTMFQGVRRSSDFSLVHESDLKIYENKNAYPRAFVMYEKPSDALDANLVPAPEAIKKAEVSYSFDHSVLTANLERDGYAVVTDAYFPGWSAYENGKELKITKAFGAFRAFKLKAGKHEIKMVYKPVSFKLSLYAVITSYAFCLGFICSRIFGKPPA